MLGSALKKLASQYRLAINKSMIYGYLQGSFVTLTDGPVHRRLSIYVGCVNVALPEGEELSPAAQCSAIIVDMVTKASGDANIYGLMRNRFMPAVVVNHSGSVVTLNFTRTEAGWNGLQRFVAEMLPRITPLTAPLQCCHCGGHTGGQGYPVEFAADTAVPMHAACQQEAARSHAAKHRTPLAIACASVGALIGAACTASFVSAGYPFVLGALLIVLLSLGGYKLLRGTPGRVQRITLSTCVGVAVLLATICIYWSEMAAKYLAYGYVVSNMISESMYFRLAAKDLLSSWSTWIEVAVNLLIAFGILLVFCASGLTKYHGCACTEKPKALPGKA